MSKIKIIKALERKGYKVESAEYTPQFGGIDSDFFEAAGWVVFTKEETLPIQGYDYKEVLKEIEKMPNIL